MDNLHAPTVASGPSSHPSSNCTSKKQSFQELCTQKENIEAELSALSSVLDSHGVNMNTSLTTFDGYPRADIDVAQIRTTRARIVRLKNDHKVVMAKVEDTVHEHFALGTSVDTAPSVFGSSATASGTSASTAQPSQHLTAAIEPPFARVNTVVPRSPADQAGMQPDDKVTKFGSVDWTNHERLGKVAQVVQENEHRAIMVKVLRESQPVQLELTPRRDWGGRGLLGCHLVPL